MSRQSHLGRKITQVTDYLLSTQLPPDPTSTEETLEEKIRATPDLNEKIDLLLEMVLNLRKHLTPTVEARDLLQDPEGFECSACQKKYNSRSHLHRHIQTSEDEVHRDLRELLSDLRCDFESCKRVFTTRDGLTKHRQWHQAFGHPISAYPDGAECEGGRSDSSPYPPPFLEPKV